MGLMFGDFYDPDYREFALDYHFHLADGKAIPWRLTFQFERHTGWTLRAARGGVSSFGTGRAVRQELADLYGWRQVLEAENYGENHCERNS